MSVFQEIHDFFDHLAARLTHAAETSDVEQKVVTDLGEARQKAIDTARHVVGDAEEDAGKLGSTLEKDVEQALPGTSSTTEPTAPTTPAPAATPEPPSTSTP